MKHELDNLPTEESIPHSPDVISPTFKNSLSRFSLGNMRREELLKFTLQEAENKLQTVQDQRRVIRGTLKEKSNIILHKIQKNREDIDRVEKQIEKLEINSANMTNAIKKHNQLKVEAFKVALKPLQDVIEMLEVSKVECEKSIEDIDEKLNALSRTESEYTEQLDEKKAEENAIMNQKKGLINSLEDMEESHPWDYKEFIKDKETKETLVKIREQKKAQVTNLNEIDKIISDLNNQSEILSRDIDSLRSHKFSTESLSKNEIELIQLEEFLNLQCKTFAGPKLSEIIQELCTLGNFPVNQMIFKEQFRIIEQKELEMIESAKTEQENYESRITELSKNIEELEVEIYAMISVQQSDHALEKKLRKARKELEDTRQKADWFMDDHNSKIQMIGKWKCDNRNILLITDTARIPTDEQVVEEFYNRLKPYVQNPEHWRAMESVIVRYCEKAKERDSMQDAISQQKFRDNGLIESKCETLKRVRAIKTSKESERAIMQRELEGILVKEKKTLKELENSKLEVESARKIYFKEQLQQSLSANSSYSRIQKTYGDKALKKFMEKESLEVKTRIDKERIEIKAKLETLYMRKQNWDESQEALKKEIAEKIQSKLSAIQQEKNKLKSERSKHEKEFKTLSEAEDDAHCKLNDLAEVKRNELVKSAKKVATTHGGERGGKIEQLYALRHKKESEICDLEAELIKLEGSLRDKETSAELEIVKLKARIQNLNTELSEIEKQNKKAEKLEKTISKIDISQSDFASDLEISSEVNPARKSANAKQIESPDSGKGIVQDPASPNKNITEEMKDHEEETQDKPQLRALRQNLQSGITEEDYFSDVSSEIPCPTEPKYKYDDPEGKNKAFFDGIMPLIEGTIIYKLFKGKNLRTFDPLESRVYTPEECGYGVRKMKLNRQLGKIEIRQIGKAGVESSIIVDQIVSIVVPSITSEIIKARGKSTNDEDHTLERSDEYNKIYRNMKAMGNVDTDCPAFIYKAKETCYFSFFITLKNGRVDFVAEGLHVYRTWLTGIKALIKNKSDLERLKFRIIQI